MAHWKQRETVFGEYELAVTMPGRWQLRPSDSPTQWLYRSAEKHKEHVSISRDDPGGIEGEEDATLRRAVARQRRAIELGFGRGVGITMSEPQYGELCGFPMVSYRGEAASAEHRFQVVFICPPRTVWTLVYDAFRLTEEQAEKNAQTIFDSITLPSL